VILSVFLSLDDTEGKKDAIQYNGSAISYIFGKLLLFFTGKVIIPQYIDSLGD